MPDRCLLLFTKPAEPGRVKTRLVGHLTAEQAADLHAAFLSDVVARLVGGRFDLRIAWALTEGEEPPFGDPPGLRQEGADLGRRLFNGLATAARRYPLVAAVGSDHPALPLEHVEAAFDALAAGADVVLGPADDGGYYLVGVRREALHPDLFDGVAWSTDSVLADTLERCRRRGLEVELAPRGADVDTPDDLAHLVRHLAAGSAPPCPATEELLASWGLLEAPAGAGAAAAGGRRP